MMSRRWRVTSLALLLAIGALLILIGVLALTLVPQIIQNQVSKMTYLGLNANGTPNDMTEQWLNPPYTMRLDIWLFSVANPDDVLNGRGKPRVIQRGPYSFKEVQAKNSFTFVDNETRVFYTNSHQYFFDANASCANCSLTDRITIPNVLFQKVVDFANTHPWAQLVLELLLQAVKETLFLTVTAEDALFKGYEDPLVKSICKKQLLQILCEKLPKRIGFFLGNNSIDGEYLIDTGKSSDGHNIGHVYSWNNLTTFNDSVWWSPQARMINGTDAQLFHPGIERDEMLQVFSSPICRSALMAYKKDVAIDGVPAYRFGPPASMLDPMLPENRGFCNPNEIQFFDNVTQPVGCLPAGLLDLSTCQPGGVRIFMSLAHFLSAPKAVVESIDGLSTPTDANDETYFDVEPTSGIVINAVRRMQINLGMVSGNLRMLSNFSNVIMPVFMVNESVRFDRVTRDRLYNELVFAHHIAKMIGVTLLSIGIIAWIAFLVVCFLFRRLVQQEDGIQQELLLEEDSNDLEQPVRARP